MHHSSNVITVKPAAGQGTGADIQKAIDFALGENAGQCALYIPAGKWILEAPLRLHPKGSPTPINTSVSLMGARPTYGVSANSCFTTLVCQFNDRPAIELQAVRGTSISNLILKGQNDISAHFSSFDNLINDDIWLLPGVTEDHLAIAIDPNAGAGSSSVLIDNVSAMCFAGGIGIGTSGDATTLNSENHTIRRFHGKYLGKAGLIFGQHQSKGVKIQDCNFFGQQYWIDCVRYGLHFGYPPMVSGCNVGGTQRLFNLVQTLGTFACHGLFVESTLSLGTIGWGSASGNVPAVFTGCHFSLWGSDGAKVVDTELYCFRTTLFQSCTFSFRNPQAFSVFRIFNGQEVVFDCCSFHPDAKNGSVPLDFSQPSLIEFRRCRYRIPDFGSQPIHGPIKREEVAIGKAKVEYLSPGRAKIKIKNLKGMELTLGDWLVSKTKWKPKAHLATSTSYTCDLAIGIIAKIGKGGIILHHVPESIEAVLPMVDEFHLRRIKTV